MFGKQPEAFGKILTGKKYSKVKGMNGLMNYHMAFQEDIMNYFQINVGWDIRTIMHVLKAQHHRT